MRHHSQCAAGSSQRPEQLWVQSAAGLHVSAIGKDDLHVDDGLIDGDADLMWMELTT